MSTPYDDQSSRTSSPAGYPLDRGDAGRPAAGGAPGTGDAAYAQPLPSQPPTSQPAPVQPPPGPSPTGQSPARGFDERGHVKRSRTSSLWITLIVAAIGLILLIVFIAQNSRIVPIHFLGFSGHLAVGLTVLIAAVVGLLLAAIPGTIRILQLRKALTTNVPKDQRLQ